ncbi:Protein of unknown function DUF1195 [Dillenia turbinata]|uniref:Uncharacterized protein n=1 Tax=Dillenia turbinata TaxID=194707 RepID=A0AAN8VZ99_9MAGN
MKNETAVFGKVRYKFCALTAILLLAFWAMFTGSVTLKLSAGNLTTFTDNDIDSPLLDDLDVLEMEEREKVARQMWNVYTHSKSDTIKLPRFWRRAFEAAYLDLTSEDPSVKDAAVSEIAMMSMGSIDLIDPPSPPLQSTSQEHRKIKEEIQTRSRNKKKVVNSVGSS